MISFPFLFQATSLSHYTRRKHSGIFIGFNNGTGSIVELPKCILCYIFFFSFLYACALSIIDDTPYATKKKSPQTYHYNRINHQLVFLIDFHPKLCITLLQS